MGCANCGNKGHTRMVDALDCEAKEWKAKAQKAEIDLKVAREIVHNLFAQGTWDPQRQKYDHMCLSAYEDAQDYLVENGLVTKEECARK